MTHGDFHAGNLLAGGAAPLAAVDFQVVSAAEPAADVAYFVAMSLGPRARRAHERRLVHGHWRHMVDEGGLDAEAYPSELFFARYAVHATMKLLLSLAVVGTVLDEDDRYISSYLRTRAEALLEDFGDPIQGWRRTIRLRRELR